MLNEVLSHPMLVELMCETTFWVLLWEFFFVRTLMPKYNAWACKQSFWPHIVKRAGTLAINGQNDLVLLMVLATHHMTAGSMLLMGAITNSGPLWRHGALMELGFELADIIANIRGVWPYDKKRVALDLRIAFAFHHLPGIVLLFPLIMNDYHHNPHLQAIGGWLLFAGGISALVGCIVYTRDFEDPFQMKQAAIIQMFGAGMFFFARWVIYPVEAQAFQLEVSNRTDVSESFPAIVQAMTISLGIFNLLVTITLVPKTARYIIKGFFSPKISLGDVPVEDGADDATATASIEVDKKKKH